MTANIHDSGHILAIVRQNPRRATEGQVQYIQRIAVLAGLAEPSSTAGEPPQGWSSAEEVLETGREEWWKR